MNTEFFIARRIYSNKDGQKNVSPPAIRVAIISIALGLAVMILSVAIVIGFKKEVRNKVIGFGSHIQVTHFDNNTSYETQAIAVSDTLMEEIRQTPGIKHAEIFAIKPGIIKTDSDFQGVVLKGVDEDFDWDFFSQNLVEGSLLSINPEETTTEIIISRYIADKLNLHLGQSVNTYFVQNDVRARKFKIKGIYQTNFAEYDKLFILGDIKHIRKLNDWDDDQVSGIEILVNDYNKLDKIAEDLYFKLSVRRDRMGNTLYAQPINQLNPSIFSWLDLLDTNVVIILLLMIAVAGFTMISGLLIIILERANMIGILKSLGQNNTSIRKIFLYISFFLISKGLLWGNVIGIGICLIQKHFGIFKLNPETYYLAQVPIDINIWQVLLLNIGTLAATLLMLVGPSYIIAKISPVKTIRFE